MFFICYSKEKMSKTAAHNTTPQSLGGKGTSTSVDSSRQKSQFVSLAVTMGWQLAVVVLIPVIGGAELDKAFKSSPALLLVGLAIALLGTILVMWRSVKAANTLPVPKLTAAQKRAIQKQYEEDDADA
jgi:F0F1-type ATP synthase assembly protein I